MNQDLSFMLCKNRNIGAETRLFPTKMSEELRRLKSVRGSYRGHCTQEFKKADRLLTSEPLNTAKLKALQDRLTRRGNDISQMDSQIAMAISEEELENEIEEALSVQDTISDYKFMIMEALKNDQHDKPVSSFHDNNSSTKPTTTRINVICQNSAFNHSTAIN